MINKNKPEILFIGWLAGGLGTSPDPSNLTQQLRFEFLRNNYI